MTESAAVSAEKGFWRSPTFWGKFCTVVILVFAARVLIDSGVLVKLGCLGAMSVLLGVWAVRGGERGTSVQHGGVTSAGESAGPPTGLRRGRPGWVAGGILLILVGGGLAAFAFVRPLARMLPDRVLLWRMHTDPHYVTYEWQELLRRDLTQAQNDGLAQALLERCRARKCSFWGQVWLTGRLHRKMISPELVSRYQQDISEVIGAY